LLEPNEVILPIGLARPEPLLNLPPMLRSAQLILVSVLVSVKY
jgi:hypothetical protein